MKSTDTLFKNPWSRRNIHHISYIGFKIRQETCLQTHITKNILGIIEPVSTIVKSHHMPFVSISIIHIMSNNDSQIYIYHLDICQQWHLQILEIIMTDGFIPKVWFGCPKALALIYIVMNSQWRYGQHTCYSP